MRCCTDADQVSTAVVPRPSHREPASWLRVAGSFASWAAPLTTLALMPKCPGCIAGYVLLFTGVGISLPVASTLRWSLLALCLAAIAYLAFRAGRGAVGLLMRPHEPLRPLSEATSSPLRTQATARRGARCDIP